MTDRILNEYLPDSVTAPGETLQEILDAIGMTKAELADRMGKTSKFVIDIIKHGVTITPTSAMELEKVLGIPASFWNNRERRYRESLARREERKRLRGEVDWLKKFPIGQMIKAGWIKKHKDKADQVDTVLKFFGVNSGRVCGFRLLRLIENRKLFPLSRRLLQHGCEKVNCKPRKLPASRSIK